MVKNLFIIPLFISLTIGAAQEQVESPNDSIDARIEPHIIHDDEMILKNKASEWAEECLTGLSAQDKTTICTLLERSYRFSNADLKLKKAVSMVFDISCGIQDKLHRSFEITEDTALLQKMAMIIGDLTQEYNNQLKRWQQEAEMLNQDRREELLDILKRADIFSQSYVNAYIESHHQSMFDGLEAALVNNIKHEELVHELVKTIYSTVLDSFNSKGLVDSDYTDLLGASFEAARFHFSAEVKSFLKIRKLFIFQELLLGLRKDVAQAFYQEAQVYLENE